MINDLPISGWFYVLILLLFSIPLILSGLGIYYLVKGNYTKNILIVSSFIFLTPIIFIIVNNFPNLEEMTKYLSEYIYKYLKFLSNPEFLMMNLFSYAVIYLSSFAIINSIHLLYKRISS